MIENRKILNTHLEFINYRPKCMFCYTAGIVTIYFQLLILKNNSYCVKTLTLQKNKMTEEIQNDEYGKDVIYSLSK